MTRSEPRGVARLIPPLALFALVALCAHGCGPKLSREEQVELLRSQYTAELKSLTVKQDPIVGEMVENEAAGEAVATGVADAAEPAATVEAAAPAVRTDVILDILVSTTSQQYLPGVTLDVEHVDADRRVKDRRTLWVDTSGLVRGGGTQVTHVLENVDWQAGDGFAAEVRTPIPAEERAEYREFASDERRAAGPADVALTGAWDARGRDRRAGGSGERRRPSRRRIQERDPAGRRRTAVARGEPSYAFMAKLRCSVRQCLFL